MQTYDPHPTLRSDGWNFPWKGSVRTRLPPHQGKCCSGLGILNGFGSIALDGDADFATVRSSHIFHMSEVGLAQKAGKIKGANLDEQYQGSLEHR